MITEAPAKALLSALQHVIGTGGEPAIAVSGGVDSMTLAVAAGRHHPDVTMFHAVSPAVPDEATTRVQQYAEREGWRLEILNAGEFSDPAYRANPVNRCYYCKTNLYGAMAAHTLRTLWSGTNTDDLGDYRPGLQAAEEHRVRHPYVEAGIDKSGVRAIARYLQLDDLAELPAAPCLSSRIETGIAIDARDLSAVHAVESAIRDTLAPRTVRCRVRAHAVVIELDQATFSTIDPETRDQLATETRAQFAIHRPNVPVRFEPYAMGSAFVHISMPKKGAP